MSQTPRRRIIRPTPPVSEVHPHHDRRQQKLRARLEKERLALSRWMTRLKRAFHSVEKIQRAILRVERQIALLEE
jgi:hypothetical protein